MQFLGYKDGTLSNLDMIKICKQLTDLISAVVQHEPKDTVVELMSLDLNGLTGHIDHIVAARSACYAFYHLKEHDARFSRIRLACIPENQAATHNTSWLFMEAGRSKREIDETVDATAHQDQLRAIVQAHHTQRSDGKKYLQTVGDNLGMNYFIVKS
jgi:LmbE family N-acetylglucosaminyl deacetylase